MNQSDLKILVKLNLSFLILNSEQSEFLGGTKLKGRRFSLTFTHDISKNGKPGSMVLILQQGMNPALHLAYIKSKSVVSTFDTRINFDFVNPIDPENLETLINKIKDPYLKSSITKFNNKQGKFQSISKKLSQELIRIISSYKNNFGALYQIIAQVQKPKNFCNAIALQQDAVDLAVKAFGLSKDEGAETIAFVNNDSAISRIRLYEDNVIENDTRWVPGWKLTNSDLTGTATFVNKKDRLKIYTANKRPLEELFGVDLIYFNENHRSFIMVQYKMMEPVIQNNSGRNEIDQSVAQEWKVRIDKQFKEEMKRMEQFNKDLSANGSYRLNSEAFFFKLVKRNKKINSSALIISFGHLTALISDGHVTGERGGLRISYQNLDGHYLRGEALIQLIKSGYIGTRNSTTDQIEVLIDAVLTGGRAAVLAIHSRILD